LQQVTIDENVKPSSPPPPPPPPLQQAPSTPRPPAPSTPPPPGEQEEDTVYSSSSGENSISRMHSPPPFRSPMRSPLMRSPGLASPPPSVPSSLTRQIISQYPDEWHEPSQGTMDDPIRINVDMGRPENNAPFDIAWIPQKIFKEYPRNVVCVRVDACPGDQNKFQMSVPSGAERQLLVRTPSRSLHYSHEEKFHRDGYSAVARNIHLGIHQNISDDPRRAWVYYLIQFPNTVVLDNAVLSQDMHHVKRRKVGVSYSEADTGIRGIGSNAFMVSWEIAERAAGIRVIAQPVDDDDAAAFA
jgi:hypothetical protein